MNKKILLGFISIPLLLASINLVHAADDINPIPKVADEWRFSVSPYGWLPQVNTTVSHGGSGSKNADLSMNNVLSNLKSGVMIAGEAHYGQWGVTGDFATATLQKSGGFNFKGDPMYRAGDKSTLQATLATLAGTYTLVSSPDVYLDALLGMRWVGLTTTFDLALVGTSEKLSASSASNATYGIAGVNSRYRIMGSNWFVPLYADVGTGGGENHMTWQAATGIGVSVSKMVDLSLTYRALSFDIKSGSNDSTLLKGIFHGPQITAAFNF